MNNMSEEREFSSNFKLRPLRRYEEMLRNNSRYYFDVDEFEEIIDHYLVNKKTAKALRAVSLAIEQHPLSTGIYLKKAQALNEKGDASHALDILKNIEGIESSNPEVYFAKGVSYLGLNNTDTALKEFRNAVRLTTGPKEELLSNIAMIFEQNDQFSYAISFFLEAYRENPSNSIILYDLAYCHERSGNFSRSAYYYELYLDTDPYSENVWYNLGVIYNQMDQPVKALNSYDYAIAIDPGFISARFNMAVTYENTGKYRNAAQAYRELLDIEPENAQFWYSLGNIYIKLKYFENAFEAFSKAVSFNPTDYESFIAIAEIYNLKNQTSESIRVLEEALKSDPENANLNYRLAAYWLILQNHQKAKYYLEKGLSINFDLYPEFLEYCPKARKRRFVKELINSFRKNDNG